MKKPQNLITLDFFFVENMAVEQTQKKTNSITYDVTKQFKNDYLMDKNLRIKS